MNEDELRALREDAERWRSFQASGILDRLVDISNNFPMAMIELSTLQNLVINCAEDNVEELAHIKYAVNRLAGITYDVFYSKELFE